MIVVAIVAVLILVLYAFNGTRGVCSGQSLTEKVKDNCYVKYAVENNDESYCSLLKDKYEDWGGGNIEAGCLKELAVINGNVSYCKKITGRYQDLSERDCYTAVAFSKSDPDICKGSNDSDYCFSWFSMIKKDPNICNSIKKDDYRKECLWRLETKYYDKNYFFCDQMATQKAVDLCNER